MPRISVLLLCLLCVLVPASTVIGAGGTSQGLVAAFAFDEATGDVVHDASGNANHGTVAGARFTSAGKNGGGLTFDGAGDLVTVPDAASLDLTTGMTLEAWVRPTALGASWRTAVFKERRRGTVYSLYAHDGHTSVGQVDIGGEKNAVGPLLPVDAWTHIAVTYNGSSLRFFVNGAQTSSVGVSGRIPKSSGPLRIGGNAVWTEWFAGTIDDVRVYNRALTAAELQADAAAPVGSGTGGNTGGDTQPPSAPSALSVTGATTASIDLSWAASSDNVGVTGYGRYRNGVLLMTAAGTSHTFSGVACDTTYTLAVDATDSAGNRSSRASVAASTAPCPTASDTQPPSTPTGLNVSAVTQTSATLSWQASSDDVGVVGYGRYRDGVLVSSGSGTSFVFSGLSCGTRYLLAVDAYDGAGNRSGRASSSATTSACASAPPPTSGTANLWVDTNGGTCVRAATAGAYVDAQACGSLNAAYLVARPGDRVYVKGGSYPSQSIADRPDLPTNGADVVFQPAPGETATMFRLTVRSHDVVAEGGGTIGFDEPNRFVFQDSADVQMAAYNSGDRFVTVEDVKAESTFVQADKVDIRYSDFGPLNICTDENGTDDNVKLWWWSVNGADRGSRNITFEYNLVHENIDSGCSGGNPHNDAIQMELDDSVIRGNRIWHCGTQCLFQGYDSRNVIIENNMIEETDACPRCGIATEVGVAGTVTLRNNTIAGNVTFSGGTIPANATVTGNIFLTGIGCDPAATYRNNIFPASGGSTCGSGARRGTPILSNGNPYNGDRQADWHLHPTDIIAHNNGDPTSIPPHDIDGQTRPQGTIDAGADEIP
jgi:chitodextrinase